MSVISIVDSLPPIAEGDIADVELLLGANLPQEYRSFLLEHNGGSPHPNVFAMSGCPVDTHGIVNRLLGISARDDDDVLIYRERYDGRVPRSLLPIGYDPGGNLICISLDSRDYGAIYFWAHDFEQSDGEAPGYENVYPIAPDFRSFLDGLADLPD